MRRRPCCTFHSLGGPVSFPCDNYDHASPTDCPPEDSQPELHFGHLIDWDIYRDAGAELGSRVADLHEAYGEAAL